MRAGRIETYVHSDSATPNKGAAVVTVTTQTDFAARSPELVAFARQAARMAFAAGAADWAGVAALFPELETERIALEKVLKERIAVPEIAILTL